MSVIKRVNDWVAGPDGDKWIALWSLAFLVGLGLGHLNHVLS